MMVSAALCIRALALPIDEAALRVTDDAYYYLKIAQNVAAGWGTTFDGISQTNGFHPLWLLSLLPVYLFGPSDPLATLRIVMVICALLYGLSLGLTFRIVDRHVGRFSAIVAIAMSLSVVHANLFQNGLETGLLVLLIWVLIGACRAKDLLAIDASASRDLLLGLLLGLVFLARLDSGFVILAVFGAVILNGLLASHGSFYLLGRKLIRVGLPSGILACSYFIWNWVSFSHLTPLSGALKSSFPAASFEATALAPGVQTVFILALLVSTLVVIGGFTRPGSIMGAHVVQRDQRGCRVCILVPLVAGALVHQAYCSIYMDWAVHWWHFGLYMPIGVYAVAVLVQDRISSGSITSSIRVVGVGAMLVLAAASWVVDAHVRRDHHKPWFEAALWASQNLPENAVVAVMDAGLFGYVSRRSTVNLDGVVNSYEYQELLRDGRLRDYLDGVGVTHLADYQTRYWADDTFRIRVTSHLYGAVAHLKLRKEREVFSTDAFESSMTNTTGEPYRFVIWRYAGDEVTPF